ncbi:hypothetical protein [Mesobacillus zeae]|uniref:hypothetical protein n=1 Tax=Mesobacillus zeae TaxID=1917180 RepID=UPI00300B10E5
MADRIQEKLQLTWSPEQIENGTAWRKQYTIGFTGGLSQRAISMSFGKRANAKKTREKRGRLNVGTSIRKRPKEVRERKESKGCMATFIERETRF